MFWHKKKKKYYHLFGLLVLVFVVVLIVLWQKGTIGVSSTEKLRDLVAGQEKMLLIFDKAQDLEASISKTPDKAELYMTTALEWKSIAEQTLGESKPFFEKSLETYEKGIEKFGHENILFYTNAGSLAERLENYVKAEEYYRKAVEISPADESGYLRLVDLYYYRLNKSKEEILPLFEEGSKIMADSTALVSGRATYLRRIGENEMALQDYLKLENAFPHHQGYTVIIAELRDKIKNEQE